MVSPEAMVGTRLRTPPILPYPIQPKSYFPHAMGVANSIDTQEHLWICLTRMSRISRIFIFYSPYSIIREIRVKNFLTLQKPYLCAKDTFHFLNG
jgi:hypothetical protein